ncbi:MAG TPA: ATP-binding protein [Thermoanaerobaculia bacterium]|nr:ATP-binding protein [Thermoanaerobaculia bacterium]
MPRLFAMCGLAFSGKTTLARAVARIVGAEYIGLDDINEERGLRGGEGLPGEEWERTSAIAIERMGRLLDAGRDVVLDDTLCFRWLRDRYAAVADRHAARFVLLYVATPLPEIYRAMARNDAIPQRNPIRPEVFETHARCFEHPSEEERPVVYDRTVPLEEWIASRLTAI